MLQNKLLLVIDVGNTNSEIGVFDGSRLLQSWRFMTKTPRTSDEYAVVIRGFLQTENIEPDDIEDVIIASVVPNIMHSLNNGIKKTFGIKPIQVGPGIKTGMPILLTDPAEVGADRIIDSVAAFKQYGGPVIVIDFGTATTYDYLDANGAMCAKATCPGIQISAEALFRNAAQLPNIAIVKPDSILSRDTVSSMQAGLVYGYLGQVEYIIKKMKEEIGRDDIKVIATGGYGRMFFEESDQIDYYDAKLPLKGLRYIYEKNRKQPDKKHEN
ncbi:MAG: type III pantothenate kinase [Eubacteriaceae bacterium]|jgi:type III pantothenate kinase